MRKSGIAIAVALSLAASACVQMQQYADLQFSPPASCEAEEKYTEDAEPENLHGDFTIA